MNTTAIKAQLARIEAIRMDADESEPIPWRVFYFDSTGRRIVREPNAEDLAWAERYAPKRAYYAHHD